MNFTASIKSTSKEMLTETSQELLNTTSQELLTVTSHELLTTTSQELVRTTSQELLTTTSQELLTTISQVFSESSVSAEDGSNSSSGDMWSTETLATLLPIVTASLEEQVVTACLLILFLLYVNITSGSLLYVIRTEYSLHTPQYMVLVAYMVCDNLYINLTVVHMVLVVITNDIHIVNLTVGRIWASIVASFLFLSVHLVALLAYERYSYFVTPLKYPIKFTKLRIYTTVTVLFVISLCIGAGADLIDPRIPVATTFSYTVKGLAGRISTLVYAVVYIIPSCTVIVMSLIRLRQVISKHKAHVQAVCEDQSAGSAGNLVKPVKQALKMIGLVSGSFWFSTLPGFMIRLGLASAGVTHESTDQRISLPMFALSRTSFMMITVLSSFLNPLIYISVLTELRMAACKCFRIKRDKADNHN